MIEGSSQWVIDRNVTAKCDIIHSKGNYLKLLNSQQMPIENVDFHSFIPSRLFIVGLPTDSACFQAKIFCATAVVAEPAKDRSGMISRRLSTKCINTFAAMQV